MRVLMFTQYYPPEVGATLDHALQLQHVSLLPWKTQHIRQLRHC